MSSRRGGGEASRIRDNPVNMTKEAQRRTGMRVFAAVATLLLVASCGGSATGEFGGRAADLWGRTFVSVAVTEDGESRPLVAGTRIKVTFEKREGGGGLRWQADCNIQGAGVEITPDRLVLTEGVSGTAQDCGDELHRQDEWLADFFGSDPYWFLTDKRLALTTGETVIELEEGENH
jgi:heat shock protein HslJ